MHTMIPTNINNYYIYLFLYPYGHMYDTVLCESQKQTSKSGLSPSTLEFLGLNSIHQT